MQDYLIAKRPLRYQICKSVQIYKNCRETSVSLLVQNSDLFVVAATNPENKQKCMIMRPSRVLKGVQDHRRDAKEAAKVV